jgi:hypothetical protein
VPVERHVVALLLPVVSGEPTRRAAAPSRRPGALPPRGGRPGVRLRISPTGSSRDRARLFLAHLRVGRYASRPSHS